MNQRINYDKFNDKTSWEQNLLFGFFWTTIENEFERVPFHNRFRFDALCSKC